MRSKKKEITWLNWKNWEMKEWKSSLRLFNLKLFTSKSKNFKTIKIFIWANASTTMRCLQWCNGMKLSLKSDLQSFHLFIELPAIWTKIMATIFHFKLSLIFPIFFNCKLLKISSLLMMRYPIKLTQKIWEKISRRLLSEVKRNMEEHKVQILFLKSWK
jgi:hypothetical protein